MNYITPPVGELIYLTPVVVNYILTPAVAPFIITAGTATNVKPLASGALLTEVFTNASAPTIPFPNLVPTTIALVEGVADKPVPAELALEKT